MTFKLNPKVNKYLLDGCMRCKYGATSQCKVNKWPTELELLRQIALESGLTEEVKWGVPVYTYKGKNIISVVALKDSANMGFFKGALLTDEKNMLIQQGNIQAGRTIKFTNDKQIKDLENVLKTYILEAIEIEKSGKKVVFTKALEPIPDELIEAFEQDEVFKNSFYSLTPGRQRGYIIYFSQPKKTETRVERIKKYKEHIFNGIGLHDKYK